MYAIIVYDVDVRRVNKVNKLLKKYLFWVQNSVFEGEITKSLFYKMKGELKKTTEGDDFVRIYKVWSENHIKKIDIGSSPEDKRVL